MKNNQDKNNSSNYKSNNNNERIKSKILIDIITQLSQEKNVKV